MAQSNRTHLHVVSGGCTDSRATTFEADDEWTTIRLHYELGRIRDRVDELLTDLAELQSWASPGPAA